MMTADTGALNPGPLAGGQTFKPLGSASLSTTVDFPSDYPPTCVCVCVYLYVYVYVCVCEYVCICVCVCVCECVRVRV